MTVQRTSLTLTASINGAGVPVNSDTVQAPVGAQSAGAQLVVAASPTGAWGGGVLSVAIEGTAAPAASPPDPVLGPQPIPGAVWVPLGGGVVSGLNADGGGFIGSGGVIDLTGVGFVRLVPTVTTPGATGIDLTLWIKADTDKG